MNKPFRTRRATAEHLEPRNLLAGGGLVVPNPRLTLDKANPSETLSINLDDPSGHEQAAVILRVRDADFPDEGLLDVNGRGEISLFGDSAGPHLDEQVAELAFTTPASWWRHGENQLSFTHSHGKYFEVQAVQIAFLDNGAPLKIVQPISSPDALHVYHPLDPDAPEGADRDLKAAVKRLSPGDTLIVHEGVYVESFGNADIPGGESWSKPITIKAEGKVVLRPKPGSDRVFTFSHSQTHHVVIDGFVMDAVNVKYEAVKITSGTGYSHNIWIRNSEITNAPLSGVLVNGPTTHNRFTNVHVHHNGRSGFHHGLYIAASDTIIENSMIDHNSGWGVHVYFQNGKIARNQVNNNVVHSNGTSGRGVGIGLYRGPGHRAVGNTVFANAQGGIAYGYGTSGGFIANNTVYAHPGDREISAASDEVGTPTTVTGNTLVDELAPAQIPQPTPVLFDNPTLNIADIVAQLDQSGSTNGASLDLDADAQGTGSGPATPAADALPIRVSKATPRHEVTLKVTNPADYESAIVTFQVIDADFADEGTLDINGKGQMSLFGPNATPKLFNDKTARVVFSTPADWWHDGVNTLTFQHEWTDGHEILGISVEFLTGPAPADYKIPVISVTSRSRRS